MLRIFNGILSDPQNIVMDLNNVMVQLPYDISLTIG